MHDTAGYENFAGNLAARFILTVAYEVRSRGMRNLSFPVNPVYIEIRVPLTFRGVCRRKKKRRLRRRRFKVFFLRFPRETFCLWSRGAESSPSPSPGRYSNVTIEKVTIFFLFAFDDVQVYNMPVRAYKSNDRRLSVGL